jgi:hypothetical protein
MHAPYLKEDVSVTATTTETVVATLNGDTFSKKSFFIINDGSQTVTYRIYGSPDGILDGDKNSTFAIISAAEADKHWAYASITGTVAGGASGYVDISAIPLAYIKISLSTLTGTSAVRIFAQKILS